MRYMSDPKYNHLIEHVSKWYDRLNAEFFDGALPEPYIMFAGNREYIDATYGLFKPGDEFEHVIAFNSCRLSVCPHPLDYILPLLHQMVHIWKTCKRLPGVYRKAQRMAHDDEFLGKAMECGLIVSEDGVNRAVNDRLLGLLRRHGVVTTYFKWKPDEGWVCLSCGHRH